MNGLSPSHLLDLAIIPALQHIGLDSKPARALVLGTAITESNLQYLKQLGSGPALGLWQCEPRTHRDIYDSYLVYNKPLEALVRSLAVGATDDELCWNLRYAAAICRIHYRRVSDPLLTDALGMAGYWKEFYNTRYGAGTVTKSVARFERAIRVVG